MWAIVIDDAFMTLLALQLYKVHIQIWEEKGIFLFFPGCCGLLEEEKKVGGTQLIWGAVDRRNKLGLIAFPITFVVRAVTFITVEYVPYVDVVNATV